MREGEEGLEDAELLELWKEMTRLLQDTVEDQDNETQQHVRISHMLLFESFKMLYIYPAAQNIHKHFNKAESVCFFLNSLYPHLNELCK